MSEREVILEGNDSVEVAKCHLMPCKIEYNKQTVKALEYFEPTIKELKAGGDEELGREKLYHHDENENGQPRDKNPILTASFRGRPLQGRKVQLPDDYRGFLLCNGLTKKKFNEFTYWNWDEIPKDSDTVVKALGWVNISKAIHGGVDPVD